MATTIFKNRFSSADLNNDVFGHSKWLRFAGFVFMILGLAMMLVPLTVAIAPALHSATVLAGLLGTSGAVYLAHALAFWRYHKLGFCLHLFAGAVYLLVAYVIYLYPLINIQMLAAFLISAYLIMGLYRIITANAQGIAHLGWSWTLLGGVADIGLAYVIWEQLPAVSIGLMGLIISVELLFTGWALLILGVNAKREIRSYLA